MKRKLKTITLVLILLLATMTLAYLTGCSTSEVETSFDGKWEFIQVLPDEPQKACLESGDVKKLKELLIRCESSGK